MQVFRIEGQKKVILRDIETIRTPRLLVFRDRVEDNLNRMKKYLESVAPGTGYIHLCPHVKTHKSSHIIRLMMDRGIASFKTSLNEVDLLCSCDVQEIFVAYPLLTQDAFVLADRIKKYNNIRFFVQVGSEQHADILRRVSDETGVNWHYYIDLDVGMHRTGVSPENALKLFRYLSDWQGFCFAGLHGYDGHNHFVDREQRETTADKSMDCLIKIFHEFQKNRIRVERVMTGGTPSFRLDFERLQPQIGNDTFLQVSPGTWIYWDSFSDTIQPGAFEIAAVILAQVIEAGEENRMTLNLGHKRWAADQGPVTLFSEPNLEVVSFNEEHTVLKHPPGANFQIGDCIFVVPKHVCSTVNLWEYFSLIGDKGKIEISESPVDGRNR